MIAANFEMRGIGTVTNCNFRHKLIISRHCKALTDTGWVRRWRLPDTA